jgi:hypothetical protein
MVISIKYQVETDVQRTDVPLLCTFLKPGHILNIIYFNSKSKSYYTNLYYDEPAALMLNFVSCHHSVHLADLR